MKVLILRVLNVALAVLTMAAVIMIANGVGNADGETIAVWFVVGGGSVLVNIVCCIIAAAIERNG